MVGIILQKVIEMYYRRKKSGKWLIEIQRKGYPRLSKSFDDLKIGKKWGRKIEHEIETGQFEDLTKASKTTVRALLEKYRDEITINKKGVKEETAKINLLVRNEVSNYTITQLKAHHLYKFKKESDLVRAPATTNKYILDAVSETGKDFTSISRSIIGKQLLTKSFILLPHLLFFLIWEVLFLMNHCFLLFLTLVSLIQLVEGLYSKMG